MGQKTLVVLFRVLLALVMQVNALTVLDDATNSCQIEVKKDDLSVALQDTDGKTLGGLTVRYSNSNMSPGEQKDLAMEMKENKCENV